MLIVYPSTTGGTLAGALDVSNGDFAGTGTGNTPSFAFTGTNGNSAGLTGNTSIPADTGLCAISADVGTFLEFYAGGRFLMDAGILGPIASGRGLLSLAMDLIPDGGTNDYTLGLSSNPWHGLFLDTAMTLTAGHAARAIYLKPGGYGANVVGWGIDMVDGYGTGYFRAFDLTTAAIVDNVFSIRPDNGVSILTLGDASSGATDAYSGRVKGADAAGSGRGGDLLLSGGSSGSGTQGSVYIPNTSGAPAFTPASHSGYSAIYADPTNNKLWMYNGSAWKSVVLS